MPNQSLPGLAAGLKRGLDRDVELMEERHQAILADVAPALESAGVGVSWLKQRLTEKVKHVKGTHGEIMIRLGEISAAIAAETTTTTTTTTIDGAGKAIRHHSQPCVRDGCGLMGHRTGAYDGFCCGRCRNGHRGHGPACERIEDPFAVVATTMNPTEAEESQIV